MIKFKKLLTASVFSSMLLSMQVECLLDEKGGEFGWDPSIEFWLIILKIKITLLNLPPWNVSLF